MNPSRPTTRTSATRVRALCARVSRRIPPQGRRGARLPRGLRRRADQGRLAGRADPAGIRRLRPRPDRGVGDHGGDQPLPAATPAPATARCTTWARCCATAPRRRSSSYLPKIASGELRLQSMGVTEPTTGTDTTKIKTTAVQAGRPLRGQRPEGLDLARPALRPDDPAGAHHAARRGEEEVARACRSSSSTCARPIGQRHDGAADRQHGQPRDQRAVLRQPRDPGREPDRRGRQGLPLHPRRPQRRAHADRRRMHRRRLLVHRPGHASTPRSASCSAGRSARTRACSSRSPRPTSRSRRPT